MIQHIQWINPFKLIHKIYIVIILGIVMCSTLSSYAKVSTQRIKEAQKWISVGEEALQKKNYGAALFAYEQAERHHPSIKHLILIAHVHSLESKNCIKAISLWQEVLQKTTNEIQRSKVKRKIAKEQKKCHRILKVDTKPSGAKVWVDQELIGFSPLTHQSNRPVKLVKASWQGVSKEKSIRQSASEHVTFTFKSKNKSLQQEVVETPAPMILHASIQCRAKVNATDYNNLNQCASRLLWEDDQFKLHLRAEQETYLYVILSNERGQHQMIFPSRTAKNLMPANTSTVLPSKGWFTLDDVGPVEEKITVIFSREPVGELEQKRGLNVAPVPLNRIKLFAMRGIKQPHNDDVELSASKAGTHQNYRFTGMDHVNQIQFKLQHEGPRPLLPLDSAN
jgi:hypothetical protein